MNDQEVIENLDLLLDMDIVTEGQDMDVIEDLANVEKVPSEEEAGK